MQQLFANNGVTTLTAAITSTATSIPVVSTAAFPTPGTDQYFLVTLQSGSNIEVVQIIGKTSTSLTVSAGGRGWEGSTAAGFPSGAACEARVTAGTLSAFDKYFSPGTTIDALVAPQDSYENGYNCLNSLDPEGSPISVLQNTATTWGILNYTIVGQDSAATIASTTGISTTAVSGLPASPLTNQYIVQIMTGSYSGYIRAISGVTGNILTLGSALPGTLSGTLSINVYRSVQDLLKTFAQPAVGNNFAGNQTFSDITVNGISTFANPVTAPAATQPGQLINLGQGNSLFELNGSEGGTFLAPSSNTTLTTAQSGQRILPTQPCTITLPSANTSAGAYFEIYGIGSGTVNVVGSIRMPDATLVSSYNIPSSSSAVISIFSDGSLWRARTFGSEVVIAATQDNQSVNLGQLRRINPNLLFNSSGEFGTVGWTAQSGWAGYSNQGFGQGSYFQFTANAVTSTLTSAGVAAPGAYVSYLTLSGQLYNAISGGNLTVQMVAYNGSSNLGVLATLTLGTGNAWTFLTASAQIPSNTTTVKLVATAIGASAATNVGLARLKVEAGMVATPYNMDADISNISSFPLAIGAATANNHAVTLGQISNYLTPAGTIIDYAGTVLPQGYLLCDGSAVSRTTYAYLFSVVGTIWGAGDGSTTFNLPNLTRRVTVGSGGTALSGPSNTVGSYGGEELHTLLLQELPVHSHVVNDNGHVHTIIDNGHNHPLNDPSHYHTYSDGGHYHGSVYDGRTPSGIDYIGSGSEIGGTGAFSLGNPSYWTYPTTTNNSNISINYSRTNITLSAAQTGVYMQSASTGISLQNTGAGSSHNIMQPSAVVLKCIKY